MSRDLKKAYREDKLSIFKNSPILLIVGLLAGLIFSAESQAQTNSGKPVVGGNNERNLQLGQVKSLPSQAKRYALIIGVDKYQDKQITTLGGATNDAKTLAEALVRYAGFQSDQVILLASDQPDERQPTRGNILRRLSNLRSIAPKDGLLLVAFAGHGMERNNRAYLLPADAQVSGDISLLEDTAINVEILKERIRDTGVSQVIVMLDACRNDPAGRSDTPNPLTENYMRGFNFDVRNKEVSAFATLYATQVGQRAYEYTEKKQGYFTWAVVEGLRGGAANQRGEVTLSNLIKFVEENVPKRIALDLGTGKRQQPFSVLEGYKADELVVSITVTIGTKPTASMSAPGVSASQIELTYWDSIKTSKDPDDFQAYLKKYPNGEFADLAKNRIKSLSPASTTALDKNRNRRLMKRASWNPSTQIINQPQ
jgi:hypothetical protein